MRTVAQQAAAVVQDSLASKDLLAFNWQLLAWRSESLVPDVLVKKENRDRSLPSWGLVDV
jgi:hypothetical protein